MIFAIVMVGLVASAGGFPKRYKRSFGHAHYVGGNDIYCDDPHEFIQRIDGPGFDLPPPVFHEPRPPVPHAVYGPPVVRPAHNKVIRLRPVHTTPIHRPIYSGPAPVYSAPAPVFSAPAPVYSAPAPVYSAPAPVYSAPAPIYSGPVPKPTTIGTYYEYREHKPEYILGPKEVHTTTVDRVKVSVPVTYTYTIQQPVRHTIRTYNPSPVPAVIHHNPPRPGLRWDSHTNTWC